MKTCNSHALCLKPSQHNSAVLYTEVYFLWRTKLVRSAVGTVFIIWHEVSVYLMSVSTQQYTYLRDYCYAVFVGLINHVCSYATQRCGGVVVVPANTRKEACLLSKTLKTLFLLMLVSRFACCGVHLFVYWVWWVNIRWWPSVGFACLKKSYANLSLPCYLNGSDVTAAWLCTVIEIGSADVPAVNCLKMDSNYALK